ncbi:hypothetical protein [Mycolicibacterium wolinskyi]|uniref:hypothetical protein n=1 Tax=Mycolicibacterium wolinskyi TaxID=59750 RepID=UPI00391791D7
MTDQQPQPQDRVVEVADRDTTIAKLVDALSALKTGRHGGEETMGLPAPMRRAAAEGLADLGFRYIEAIATHRVVMPKQSWLGPHAAAGMAQVDEQTMTAAMHDFSPELAEKFDAADTDAKRAALLEELRPVIESTLERSLDLDEAASALRAQGRHDAAKERQRREDKERGE